MPQQSEPPAEQTPALRTAALEVRGARTRNLQSIDVDIPLQQFVVLTGVSGSGKSSLAIHTIAAQGRNRVLEALPPTVRQRLGRWELPDVDSITRIPPPVLVAVDPRKTLVRSNVATAVGIEHSLGELFVRVGELYCPHCDTPLRRDTPESILAELPAGDDAPRALVAYELATKQRSLGPAGLVQLGCLRAMVAGELLELTTLKQFPRNGAIYIIVDRISLRSLTASRWSESVELAFSEGNGACSIFVERGSREAIETLNRESSGWQRRDFSRYPRCPSCQLTFALPQVEGIWDPPVRAEDPAPAGLRIAGTSFLQLQGMTGIELGSWLEARSGDDWNEEFLPELISSLRRRVRLWQALGMGYLTLDRPLDCLSTGELSRLLLVNAVGSALAETLLIVEEPASGLHPAEIPRLHSVLREALTHRRSVLVVEHSPSLIAAADHVVELGPAAGSAGGCLMAHGAPQDLLIRPETVTARGWLQCSQPVAETLRDNSFDEWIEVAGISGRNLREVQLRIPVGGLTVVTGISGSGKSSLIIDALPLALAAASGQAKSATPICEFSWKSAAIPGVEACEIVPASPLTLSQRSTVVTWLKVFDDIRRVFAETADAKRRGWQASKFSYASSQGLGCLSCHGRGSHFLDLATLADVSISCPECGGTRYRGEVLDVRYRGQTIVDVLGLTIAEALPVFRNHAQIHQRFSAVMQLGLEYLVLGQSTASLSAGEAQRLRLAAQLWLRRTTSHLFLCDEPAAGIHPTDVPRLANCCRQLVDAGATLVLIDHQRSLLEAADWILELGPGAGPDGGTVVASGTPVALAATQTSLAGRILRGECFS